MQPNQDYKKLLTEVIQKQIVILGPHIAISRARNVKGITITDDGTVSNIEGVPQAVTQELINEFVQLSGEIVKKTMEPLLSINQSAPNPLPLPQQPVEQQVIPQSNLAQQQINQAVSGNTTTGQPNIQPAKNPLAA